VPGERGWRHQQLAITGTAADNQLVALHDGGVDPEVERLGRAKRRDPTNLHAGQLDGLVSRCEAALAHTELLAYHLVDIETVRGQHEAQSEHRWVDLASDHDRVRTVLRSEPVCLTKGCGIREVGIAIDEFVAKPEFFELFNHQVSHLSDSRAGHTGAVTFAEFTDPYDGTTWNIDVDFIASNWTCIWDRGCEGILRDPTPELQQGCCSVGAQMIDDDEAMRIGGLGLSLDPAHFQFHEVADAKGVFSDETRTNTRVVDGACIFLNRPGFAGGEGCALHLGAVKDDENPIEYKPTICWQAPLKVDQNPDGSKTLRPWVRDDWDGGSEDMAWCCPERDPGPGRATAYVGDRPVAESLHAELRGIVGPEIAVELRERFS